jgi:hypothetical protein
MNWHFSLLFSMLNSTGVGVVLLMIRLYKMKSMKTLKHDVLKCMIDTYMILQD